MSLSGQVVSQQIQRAYQETQAELERTRNSVRAADDALRQITTTQSTTLEDLAKVYLPSLEASSVEGVGRDLRKAVQAVVLRQQDAVSRLTQQVDELDEQRTKQDARVAESQALLDKALDEQSRLAEQLARLLSENKEFQELTANAASAEAALERAEASLEEIEHEAIQKTPAYENSRLFMYLYERGLATPKYEHRGLTRRMDRWVSKLIDYPKAKSSYEYLINTPKQVRKLVAEDQQALDVVMGELERQRDEVADEIGLTAAVNTVEQADDACAAAIATLTELETSLAAKRSELRAASDPAGQFHLEAIGHIRDVLAHRNRDDLAYDASRTPDPRDDQIVARLEAIDDQIRSAKTDSIARQQRIDWLDRFLGELAQFQHRFRAADFDSSRSQFDASLNLQHELAMAREGRDTIDSVWQRMRRRQRFVASSFARAGNGLNEVVRHPMTQVLVQAMATAAAQQMSQHARRAGQRYSNRSRQNTSSRSQPSNSRPQGTSRSRSSSRPPSRSRPGGFRTGRRY